MGMVKNQLSFKAWTSLHDSCNRKCVTNSHSKVAWQENSMAIVVYTPTGVMSVPGEAGFHTRILVQWNPSLRTLLGPVNSILISGVLISRVLTKNVYYTVCNVQSVPFYELLGGKAR